MQTDFLYLSNLLYLHRVNTWPLQIAGPILTHNPSYYLLGEVFDYLSSRGHAALGKTINLTNKLVFLLVSKALSSLREIGGSGGRLAPESLG